MRGVKGRIAGIFVVLVLGIGTTLAWVPVLETRNWRVLTAVNTEVTEVAVTQPFAASSGWTWSWNAGVWPFLSLDRFDGWVFRGVPAGTEPVVIVRVRWPIVFLEQALILLLGGGLLTWVVRRERRRRAAT